jgi:hypothetical protein
MLAEKQESDSITPSKPQPLLLNLSLKCSIADSQHLCIDITYSLRQSVATKKEASLATTDLLALIEPLWVHQGQRASGVEV